MTRVLSFASAFCLAIGLTACSSGETDSAPTSEDVDVSVSVDTGPSVATVNGQSISLGELEAWMKEDLFEREVAGGGEAHIYEARAEALDRMITEQVVERVAAESGSSADALVAIETAKLGPVTDEEVSAFFEEHRARFRPTDTLEARAPQIKSFLERGRTSQAVESIRERAQVVVMLEPPRFEVAATGPSKGPADARVTIVEFSDYQCPYCARAEPIVAAVLAEFPDDVRVVYRHMPLDSIHADARGAAEAAVCAEEQGKFWEFHEVLFANQRELAPDDLTRYAGDLDLDMEAFAACLGEDRVRQRVEDDVRAASDAGANGTPAFFVNGVLLSGSRPVDEFVRIIRSELEPGA